MPHEGQVADRRVPFVDIVDEQIDRAARGEVRGRDDFVGAEPKFLRHNVSGLDGPDIRTCQDQVDLGLQFPKSSGYLAHPLSAPGG